MGISMSTLAGWVVIGCIASYYTFRYLNGNRVKLAGKATALRPKQLEEKPASQPRKDVKDKAKRQRGEAYTKDTEESDKSTKAKPRTAAKVAATPAAQPAAVYSSEDDLDNREFARQLASVKQGTSLNGPKKSEEKRARSVKQSRAREMENPADALVSGPSSTAGADGDDDESSVASPEVKARDHGDVSDMLEPKAAGPSVLRLTDTDKIKEKEKKVKAPEKVVETKKQRQNRQKAEAAKALREEVEKERKVMMEAQRRLARISEGRPAKDGSAFMASQAKNNAWTATGASSKPNEGESETGSGGFLPVQPLDTFDTPLAVNAPVETPKVEVTVAQDKPKSSTAKSANKNNGNDSWMSTLPSEEEQMEMLREEEAWSTVKTKKSGKLKNKGGAAAGEASNDEPESTVTEPQQLTPVTNPPVVVSAQKTATTATNGKPAKSFTQQSSFAALSTDDDVEAEEEWDV